MLLTTKTNVCQISEEYSTFIIQCMNDSACSINNISVNFVQPINAPLYQTLILFWEAAGTYELLLCSRRNAASVVVTCEDVVTFNHYKMIFFFQTLCTKRQWGHKNVSINSSARAIASTISSAIAASARDTSHLVKLSLANILLIDDDCDDRNSR